MKPREDLLGLEEIAKEIELGKGFPDYLSIGLRYNPFPASAVASGAESYEIGEGESPVFYIPVLPPVKQEHVVTIRDFARSALAQQQFAGLQVIGDYGFGKSHLLRFIEHQINEFKGSIRGGRIRAFYIKNPSTKPQGLLFSVTKSIGEQELRNMTWSTILSTFHKAYTADKKSFQDSFKSIHPSTLLIQPRWEQLDTLFEEDALANYKLFLDRAQGLGISREDLRSASKQYLRGKIDNLEITEHLLAVAFGSEMSSFQAWVALTSAEGRRGLKAPQTDHFRAILRILQLSGIAFVFLLVDEFEDIAGVRLTPRQQAEYEASLRMFIDSYHNDFAMVLAATAEATDIIRRTYNPFLDRFTHRIDLTPLTEEETETVLLRYLNSARVEGAKPFERNQHPFRLIVGQIVKHAKGNARATLNICHKLIEFCREQKKTRLRPQDLQAVLLR
jgi:type II secretory pathway predicted ATPase ExeA